jgi:beta-lactamase superfamily II metal-dependent hydrolase
MTTTPKPISAVRLLSVLFLAIQAVGALPIRAGLADQRLDIYWVDVEGGAATLIVTPAGESILIDTGYPGDRDAGRIHKVATEVAGLKQIDHLVITHYHVDHFGGAAPLSALIPIRNVYDNGPFKEGWEKPSKEYLDFPADKRVALSPGDDIPLKQSTQSAPLRIQCLAARQQFASPPYDEKPNPDCADVRRQRPDYTDNANSIVLLLTFGDFDFFNAGDLSWNQELRLVCPVKLVPEVDLFQVTHHARDTSNPPAAVRALSPTVAVINNGPRKGGDPKTFATLKATPSIQAIYQLHRNVRPGEEDANTDDAHIANAAETCDGNHIQVSVSPDGASYTLSIPARDHSAAFRTKPAPSPTR